jgi:hypothetical protein
MTVYTFDESIVSDLHKDARGFRPSAGWWDCWNFQDNDGKQAAWNTLVDELAENNSRGREREKKAIKDFEDRIELLVSVGARDRDTAIRWIIESLNLSEIDKMYGGSYICYLLDLPYSMEIDFNYILKANV